LLVVGLVGGEKKHEFPAISIFFLNKRGGLFLPLPTRPALWGESRRCMLASMWEGKKRKKKRKKIK